MSSKSFPNKRIYNLGNPSYIQKRCDSFCQNMPSLGQILAKGEQRVTLRWFWGEQWGRVMAPYKAADAMTHTSSGEPQLVKPAPSHGRGAITINLSNMAQTVVITWKRLVRGGFQLVESNNSKK